MTKEKVVDLINRHSPFSVVYWLALVVCRFRDRRRAHRNGGRHSGLCVLCHHDDCRSHRTCHDGCHSHSGGRHSRCAGHRSRYAGRSHCAGRRSRDDGPCDHHSRFADRHNHFADRHSHFADRHSCAHSVPLGGHGRQQGPPVRRDADFHHFLLPLCHGTHLHELWK